jgi:CheY-like chemotaxis protein
MPKVLIIDDDGDIAELVAAVLTDEGMAVSILSTVSPEAIRVAVGQLEPDCVLLDGGGPAGFGPSWLEAAWLHDRSRPVPVIMFTADAQAVQEALEQQTERSRAAPFVASLAKPFNLDELVETIARCVGQAVPFNQSIPAEAARTQALVERLEAAGAQDIHASTRREWANFRNGQGAFLQLYWWQRDGVYYLIRHAEAGGVLEQVGRFYDLDAAIALAMTVPPTTG